MTRLGIRIAHTLHVLQDLFRFSQCHTLCVRVTTEKSWRYLIDTFVCTLSTQQGGNQQLEYAAELQLRTHMRHAFPEILQ